MIVNLNLNSRQSLQNLIPLFAFLFHRSWQNIFQFNVCVEQIRDITAMTQSDSFYAPLSLFLHPNILFSPAYNTAITAYKQRQIIAKV